jgi:uncharacterized protein YbcI
VFPSQGTLAGFLFVPGGRLDGPKDIMNENGQRMARRIAEAAIAFERQRTGHAPESVSVVLGEGTLVITLHGALSPAELALARTADGAARVEQLQRQLFHTAGDVLRRDIHKITGSPIREADTEIERSAGTIIRTFPSGTLVQVYLLAGNVPVDHWSGTDPGI